MSVTDAFARHERIAFQFSGGRDSTAALYLLRDFWDRMTVYHVDTGDQFPETAAVVRQVELDMGRRVERIAGDVHAVRATAGLASDLVPAANTGFGRLVSGRPVQIIGRYECCWLSLMAPMHKRMLDDGITLIVRGQRDDEFVTPPVRSGAQDGGFEFLYPVQAWTGDQVSGYLIAHGYPLAPFYERGMSRAPECVGCTAWWTEGRAEYLARYHPAAHQTYLERMGVIRGEIDRQYQFLKDQP